MRAKRIYLSAFSILFVSLTLLTSIEHGVGAALRNQVGIAVVKTLSMHTKRGFWPYELDRKLDEPLFSPIRSHPAFSSYQPNRNDFVLTGIEEVLQTKWQAAERSFEKATGLDSGDPMAHFWLGVVQRRQGQKSQAIANWAHADALPYLLQLGGFYMREGNYGEAREWYQSAMAVAEFSGAVRTSGTNLGQAYRDLGKLEWDQGRIEPAVRYYESALEEMPDRTLFLYELAQLYSLQSRFDEAIPLIHTLMQIEPNAASWPSVLGAIYQQSARPDLAEQAYLQALQTGTDQNLDDRCWHARTWLGLGSMYAVNQSWQRSLTASIQAVQVNQGLSSGWQNQLRENFDRALAAVPAQRDWYMAVGDTFEQVGDTQSALDYYRRAAQLWPDSTEVQERLNDMPKGKTIAQGACP